MSFRLSATGSNGGDPDIFTLFSATVAGVLPHPRSSPASAHSVPVWVTPSAHVSEASVPDICLGDPDSAVGALRRPRGIPFGGHSGCLPLGPTAGIRISSPSSPRPSLVRFLINDRRRRQRTPSQSGYPPAPAWARRLSQTSVSGPLTARWECYGDQGGISFGVIPAVCPWIQRRGSGYLHPLLHDWLTRFVDTKAL